MNRLSLLFFVIGLCLFAAASAGAASLPAEVRPKISSRRTVATGSRASFKLSVCDASVPVSIDPSASTARCKPLAPEAGVMLIRPVGGRATVA